MGMISDFWAARSRASVEKFERDKQQYVGEMWDAAQAAAERTHRDHEEQAARERDELAARVQALEAELSALKAQLAQEDAPEAGPAQQEGRTVVAPSRAPLVPSRESKGARPVDDAAAKPASEEPHKPQRSLRPGAGTSDARMQIREQHPAETDGLVLHHDERLDGSAFEKYGFDAWYTVDSDDTIAFYYRKKSPSQPPEWNDRWWGPDDRFEVLERLMFEHGIPLFANNDRVRGLVARAHKLQHGKDARKAAAMQELCDRSLREVRLVLDAGDALDGLDEETRLSLAVHLARRVGYRYNRSLDAGDELNWAAAYPYLDGSNYLCCCLLESMCADGAKGMVIPRGRLGHRVDVRAACVDLIHTLELPYRLLAELDEQARRQAGVVPEEGAVTLFDLVKRQLVCVRRSDRGVSFDSLPTEQLMRHEAPLVNEWKAEVCVSGTGYQGAHHYLEALAVRDDRIELCGAYKYTEGDMHDATWDHDYYFIIGARPRDFGVVVGEDDGWSTHSLFLVNSLSKARTYDRFYLHIADTYLAASPQKPKRGEETRDLLGLGTTLTFVPVGASKAIDPQAQHILRSLQTK